MKKDTLKTTFDSATRVIDSYKSSDKLLVRKKFSMSDIYFRRGCPEHELFRFELAFDTELCVIAVAAALGAISLIVALARMAKRREERRLRRKYERSIRKAKAVK